ncbi:MAG: InlB B-repeat-containing protein [Treponema sp.]|jgi:uncharacterized repeat protein (TIGR02543 family)|nr:InlB B-repeat-containing protein [Treponema sp.]
MKNRNKIGLFGVITTVLLASVFTVAALFVMAGCDETLNKHGYTLATDASPANGGSVTRAPDLTSYTQDAQVTVTAWPAEGYRFTGWSDNSGEITDTSETIEITMDGHKILTANFETILVNKYTLSVNVSPVSSGTVTRNPSKGSYDAGSSVSVSVVPKNGYKFKNWSGASDSTDNPVTITMDDNKTLTANFVMLYNLITTADPANGGSVTRAPDLASYTQDAEVTVTAVPDNGYKFKNWSGASTSTANPVTITMDGSKNLIAVFEHLKAGELDPNRIYVNKANNTFEVDGKRIWINGVNTPWDKWNDFGGSYNDAWWDNEFGRLKAAGINATRIWINCNGYGSITIAADGTVSGATAKHWQDLDKLFALAKKHKIYIKATLLSFDHFGNDNYQSDRWRAMIRSKPAVKSFADNYTIPFVERYGANPWLWCIDMMNEPDWLYENKTTANIIQWNDISYFFAYNAAAIHENSDVLVTVGMACIKYNADGSAYEGNKVSDASLRSQYNSGNPCLDFWSPHTYEWVGEWYGVAHYLAPSGTRQGDKTNGYYGGYGLDGSKPAIIGECSANGTTSKERGFIRNQDRPPTANTITTDYEYAYNNGWQGVMPWTSNGVDGNGNLNNMKAATLNMETKYPDLIYPMGK